MINFSKEHIAKDDIICYKHIYEENGKYYSSFRGMEIEFGVLYKAAITIDGTSIGPGLHSYRNIEDTEEDAELYHEILVECVIPKDSVYYKGTSSCISSFVSNQLMYQRILKRYDRPMNEP